VTLTPTLTVEDGAPWLAFSVQGESSQIRTSCSFS
jgi:hypothetical protein